MAHAHAIPETASAPSPAYRRRRPERTALYQVVAEHLDRFLEQAARDGHGLPAFVEREMRAYLDCGILANGFVRVRCPECKRDALVAFSCKGRGFCPGCGGRRMADTAAWLVDRVFPRVRVRQWVLTLPFRLRLLAAYDASVASDIRRIFIRAALGHLRRDAKKKRGISEGRGGAVTITQRFGSALNLNVHFHAMVLDGVYVERDAESDPDPPAPDFHTSTPPTDEQIHAVLERIARQVRRLLERRAADAAANDEDERRATELLARFQADAVAGRNMAKQGQGRLPGLDLHGDFDTPLPRKPRCADLAGFTLHAGVTVPPNDRLRLEHLCRYALRPPVAQDRLYRARDGRVVYELRRPFRDGTRRVVFEPLAFLARLAALVPPPRAHQIVYSGVLAPASRLRARIVPAPPAIGDGDSDAEGGCGSYDPIDNSPDDSPPPRSSKQRRYAWAALLKRVFAVDALTCPHCGAKREILAVITEPGAVRAILRCLGFDDRAPPGSATVPHHPIDEDGELVLFPGDETPTCDLDMD